MGVLRHNQGQRREWKDAVLETSLRSWWGWGAFPETYSLLLAPALIYLVQRQFPPKSYNPECQRTWTQFGLEAKYPCSHSKHHGVSGGDAQKSLREHVFAEAQIVWQLAEQRAFVFILVFVWTYIWMAFIVILSLADGIIHCTCLSTVLPCLPMLLVSFLPKTAPPLLLWSTYPMLSPVPLFLDCFLSSHVPTLFPHHTQKKIQIYRYEFMTKYLILSALSLYT